MSTATLISVAIAVFVLMLIGLVLTVIEFKDGAPKDQIEDKDKIMESPHGHVD